MIVQSHRGEYSVGRGSLIDALPAGLSAVDRMLIDRTILARHPSIASLAAEEQIYCVAADESLKSLESVTSIISWLLETGFNRAGTFYVVGGGSVQDAGSFAASVLHRGIRWVYVPTTLLAQGDSCIGSKSSLNFRGYKNQLGTFYPPASIIVDESFLSTLPPEEIRAGLGEMLHYAVLAQGNLLSVFEGALANEWRSLSAGEMTGLAMKALTVKQGFIEADEFDTGFRKNLNFGHTFAHGIEFASRGQIPHGIAVAYGVDMANAYAEMSRILAATTASSIRQLVRRLVDGSELSQVTGTAIFDGIRRDKKRSGDNVELVLIEDLGKPLRIKVDLDEQFGIFLDEYLARW